MDLSSVWSPAFIEPLKPVRGASSWAVYPGCEHYSLCLLKQQKGRNKKRFHGKVRSNTVHLSNLFPLRILSVQYVVSFG